VGHDLEINLIALQYLKEGAELVKTDYRNQNPVFNRLQEHDDVTAISTDGSEQLVLQSHVVLRLEAEESTENVGESSTLLSESVDDRSASWSEGCLTMLAILQRPYGWA
jgi:hypothetical protein